MKLIEKKCPNCGAGLEFKDSDKNCKCTHCGSSFEIERDSSKPDSIEQFDLKPMGKVFSIFYALSFIESAVIFVIAAVVFGIIFFGIYNSEVSNNKYVSSANSLSNSDISHIEHSSKMKISYRGEGMNDHNHSYYRSSEPRREKLYVAYKNDGNYIIVIYKATYHDFFHQENSYTVYVPIVYENVKGDIAFNLGDGEVRAPEYYFNEEKTSYTYGYASFEEAYNGVVKPLEKDYKITEK